MANGEGLVKFYAMPSHLDAVNLLAKPLQNLQFLA
jgi:hypothetical protein